MIDVGYNDQAEDYAAHLDEVMQALLAAGVRQVVWVTLEEAQEQWGRINDADPCSSGTLAAADAWPTGGTPRPSRRGSWTACT